MLRVIVNTLIAELVNVVMELPAIGDEAFLALGGPYN